MGHTHGHAADTVVVAKSKRSSSTDYIGCRISDVVRAIVESAVTAKNCMITASFGRRFNG